MKRLKYFLTAVCFLLSIMALSPIAFADVVDKGSKAWLQCSFCGKYGWLEFIAYRQATETSSGYVSVSCPSCSKVFSRSTRYWPTGSVSYDSAVGLFDIVEVDCIFNGPELGYVTLVSLSLDCSKSGLLCLFHLGSCDASSTFPVSPPPHSFTETRCTPATCIAPGSILSTCSHCQGTKTESLPALGHAYTSNRTESTCTTPGSIVSTCSRCQDVQTEPLPALDHDWQEAVRVAPTCITPGSITSTCSRCQDTQTETLPTLYHSWESGEMVPSTYDEDGNLVTEGYTFYNCSSCGSSFTAVAGSSPPDSGVVSGGIGGEGMSDTTAALGKTFFSGIWALFAIGVPGFGFTFGQMWLGVLLASVSILVVRMIFGFGGGPRGETSRTSSTNNPRISKERQRDEF
ncbi:MAG: hypothetical protein K2O45_10045 [Oscillospiraceae bacterium]|nr:hypothetical protein [Oscillospiraceae bacterium]